MEIEKKEEMNDGMYLDAMNQLKDKFLMVEDEIKSYKDDIIAIKKELITFYGLIRVIDEISEDSIIDPFLKDMIECSRGRLSSFMDTYIFGS